MIHGLSLAISKGHNCHTQKSLFEIAKDKNV